MPNFLDGFNIAIVLIVYGTVILISVLIIFLKWKYNHSEVEESDVESSWDELLVNR